MAPSKPSEIEIKGWAQPSREGETDIDLIPGTEIMKDAGGVHFVHAQNSSDSVVLIPQPTNRSDDPLVTIRIVTRLASRS